MTDIANVYGQALYDLAKDENLTDEILKQVSVLDEGFSAEPAFIQLQIRHDAPVHLVGGEYDPAADRR